MTVRPCAWVLAGRTVPVGSGAGGTVPVSAWVPLARLILGKIVLGKIVRGKSVRGMIVRLCV